MRNRKSEATSPEGLISYKVAPILCEIAPNSIKQPKPHLLGNVSSSVFSLIFTNYYKLLKSLHFDWLTSDLPVLPRDLIKRTFCTSPIAVFPESSMASYGETAYFISPPWLKRSFSDARTYCQHHGADLALIKSEDINVSLL